MKPKLALALAAAAVFSLAACGQDENASRGPSGGNAAMKDAPASPGTKGPGKVDRGGGSGEGATVGESQNRDTKTPGAASGAK